MSNVASWILTHQWAMLPEMLETIISIAQRENSIDGIRQALQTRDTTPLANAESAQVRDGIAILSVIGPIFPRANIFTQISGATSLQTLSRDFQIALDDPRIDGIVFTIDSPGGEVTGVNEFASMVRAARSIKPVTAYVEGQGASAAYWILSAAGDVIINESALVGSIGVVSAQAPKGKDTIEIVSSRAPDKRVDASTDEGKAKIQAVLNDIEDVFVNSVSISRGVSVDKVVSDFGKGGMLVGRKAVDAGMADMLGSFESTIEMMKTKINIRRQLSTGGSL